MCLCVHERPDNSDWGSNQSGHYLVSKYREEKSMSATSNYAHATRVFEPLIELIFQGLLDGSDCMPLLH